METTPTVGQVLYNLIRHPIAHVVRRWNWKSAILSSSCRAVIFLVVNLPAGLNAGLRAMVTEIVFRVAASGALGSATQAFRTARPPAVAMMTALLFIPAAGHFAEFVVHNLAGTARLGESIAVSVTFSMLTTAFNLFAMRRGALIVGAGQESLGRDLRRLPRLIAAFIVAMVPRPRRPA
jgi:hypothetical protein